MGALANLAALDTPSKKRLASLAQILDNNALAPLQSRAWATATHDDSMPCSDTEGETCPAREAETLVVDSLCNADSGNFTRDLYGDVVQRISRAYLAAMPAFYRLRTSKLYPSEVLNRSLTPSTSARIAPLRMPCALPRASARGIRRSAVLARLVDF